MPSHAATLLRQPPTPPPLRSIDEHGLALMLSLSRPRQGPTWWGAKYEKLQVSEVGRETGHAAEGRGRGASLLTLLPTCSHMQARCAHVLESSATHYTIIALTLLDLGIVVTELILSSIFPAAEQVPHAGAGRRGRVWQHGVSARRSGGLCSPSLHWVVSLSWLGSLKNQNKTEIQNAPFCSAHSGGGAVVVLHLNPVCE